MKQKQLKGKTMCISLSPKSLGLNGLFYLTSTQFRQAVSINVHVQHTTIVKVNSAILYPTSLIELEV